MTAVAESPPAPAVTFDPAPSPGRLVLVELRKMTDTRAGFWLLLATLAIALGGLGLMLAFERDEELYLRGLYRPLIQAVSILLPVLGILAATSEFSQRTALATFTLVPRRERVIVAKLLACVVLAVAVIAVCLQIAVLGNVLAPAAGGDGSWALSLGDLGTGALYQATGLFGGFAIGLALMRSAPAIVLAYLVPTAFAILAEAIPGFRGTADWLDTSVSSTRLAQNDMDGELWAQLLTSQLLWLGVPLAIGFWRVRRRDIA